MSQKEGKTMFLREPTHILLVVLVLILLFGAKRLPDSARALGRSLRIFKGELKNTDNGAKEDSKDTGSAGDTGDTGDTGKPSNSSKPE